MMFLKNYCMEFMVCATYSSTMLSLIIFNFPFVFTSHSFCCNL